MEHHAVQKLGKCIKALAKAVTGRRMSTARRPSIDISAGIAQTSGDALLSESRVLVLYTGGTIGMKNIDGG